jgi:subtilisin family serine protease
MHPHANQQQFLQDAKNQGLHPLGRVYGSNWLLMSVPEGAAPQQAMAAARTFPGVLRTTADPIVRINDQIPPHDPIYKDDDDPTTKPCDPLEEICDPWDLVDQWGLFKVEAEGGWLVQRGTPNITIAILDSGIDVDHDDLWGNIWTNPGEIPDNGIDDDANGFVDDVHGADFCGDNVGDPLDDPASQDANPDNPKGGEWIEDPDAWPFGIRFDGDPAVGDAVDNNLDQLIDLGVFHGTFVGGIAGAMTDNINPVTEEYEGMAGACWHCKLMPVRLINAEGWAFGSDAAAAVYYATDKGANVINISWGLDLNAVDAPEMDEIQVLSQAIDYAVSKGVIVVAAAGNSNSEGLHFPACMPNTIAVGSSNWLDQRSDFSNFAVPGEIPDNGIDDDGNGWVDDILDVIAPGELIWSTTVLSAYDALLYDFLGLEGWEPGSSTYGQADGTSFSTPLVSGYVGLILSQNPDATLSQVREIIRSNAVDIVDPNGVGDSLVGYDAYAGFGRIRLVVPPPGIFVDFGTSGLYTYNGTTWDRINSNNPAGLGAYANKVVANFLGLGLYEHDGSDWKRISTNDAQQGMVGIGSMLYVDFGSSGLYSYDGSSWQRINRTDPDGLASYGNKLVVNYPGLGLYEYDGSWSRISTNDGAESMVGLDSTLYVDFGSSGLYSYDGSSWSRIVPRNPSALATFDGKLAANFPGPGLYEYDGSWSRINKNDTAEGMCGVGASLYVDFGATGLYRYDGSNFQRISTNNCEDMVAAEPL